MNKKVLSLVLALVIVLGSFGTIAQAATEYTTQDQKIQWLRDKEIVVGRNVNADGSADLALDKTITRAEVTKLIVYTLKLENLADALKGVMQPFPDVTIDHWANGYISVATTQRADIANGRRIIIGYPDGKFYPENNVTYAELATMLVRIVKKDLTDAMERNAIWATSYMRWAEEEGILKGLTVVDSDKAITRRDAFEMIFNAMYKLGKYDQASVKFGDVMGIVSKFQSGTIQLNQDEKMTYKITANTMVTDGTTWRSLAANVDFDRLGSLVRLIADKDGNVTHILELGNNRELALGRKGNGENPLWFSVAKYTAEGNARFEDNYIDSNIVTVNGVSAKIVSGTKFFVADVQNNALKEVKTLSEVLNVYVRDRKDIPDVYMGYDEYYGNNNEVKVIVFNKIDKYQGAKDVRRVTRFLNSNLNFAAEDTKGVETIYNLKDVPTFPGNDLIDVMDVVDIRLNSYNFGFRRNLVKIDYSEDYVYRVKELSNSNRKLVLEDKDGYVREFYLPTSAKIFVEGQLKKGAHVQVFPYEIDRNTKEIEIVSVVNKDLKGTLPEGIRDTHKGFVQSFNMSTGEVVVVDKNGRNPQYYHVSKTESYSLLNTEAKKPMETKLELVFELSNMYTDKGLRIVYAVEVFESSPDRMIRLAEEAIRVYKANPTRENYEAAEDAIARVIDTNVKARLTAWLNRNDSDFTKVKNDLLNVYNTKVGNVKMSDYPTLNEAALKAVRDGLLEYKAEYEKAIKLYPELANDDVVEQRTEWFNTRVGAYNDVIAPAEPILPIV